jgi:hypothetical protein
MRVLSQVSVAGLSAVFFGACCLCLFVATTEAQVKLSALPQRISSETVDSVRAYVPSELHALFTSGQIEIEAASQVAGIEAWDLNRLSQVVSGASLTLDAAAWRKILLKAEILPFGSASSIAADIDAEQSARKILMNSSAALAQHGYIEQDLRFFSLASGKLEAILDARLARVYPIAIEDVPLNSQFFRERFSFESPEKIQGYSWLTYRFLPPDEDMVWIYSPAIKKVRQVSAENRYDEVLKLGFSVDDLFTWSGAFQAASVQNLGEREIFFPFAPLDWYKGVDAEDGCRSLSAIDQNQGLRTRWNFASLQFPRGAGWLPSSVVYVPRKMWKLEILPSTPYAGYSRIVLYVDQQTQLPIFKFVFDLNGELSRMVQSLFGVDVVDGRPQFFWQGASIFSPHDARALVLSLVKQRTCRGSSAKPMLDSFEPQKLGPGVIPAPQ